MRITIRLKIITCIMFGVLAVGITTVVMIRRVVVEEFTKEMLEMAMVMTRHLAEEIVAPMLENDLSAANMSLHSMVQMETGVEYAFLVNNEGKLLVATIEQSSVNKILRLNKLLSGTNSSLKYFSIGEKGIYDIAYRVLKGDVGRLHMGFSNKKLQTTLDDFNKTFLLSVFAICIFGFMLAVYITNHITSPLENMVQKMRQVREGNLDVSLGELPNDEIGSLGQTFNTMLVDLKKSRKEIEQYNRTLEERVQERTRDLAIALGEVKKTESELQLTVKELESSNAELKQFVYISSHDLQEPLRLVVSYTQLLAKRYQDKLDAEANEFIGFAVEGASRMRELLSDLLVYLNIITNDKKVRPTDLEALVSKIVASFQAQVEEIGAVITHDALPTIMVDSSQFVQLFYHLIHNALKFHAEKPPKVHIGVKEEKGEWLFFVRDNGIGVDPRYVDQIFVVFKRLHKRIKYSGTGVGLAICEKVVNRHNGRIWLESELGKGTVFYFSIPKGT